MQLTNDKIENREIIFFLFIILVGSFILEQPILDLQNDLLNPNLKFHFIPANSFPVFYIILRFVKGCVFAPIIEELFFRGFIQRKLNKKYSFPISLFVASSLFSIQHFDLENLIPSFILGFILGYIYFKTKNIKYSIILHSASNFIALFINFFGGTLIAFIILHKYDLFYWLIEISGLLLLYFGIKLFNRNLEKEKIEV
ncbi:MAG: CPBP family intramembrane metalloprotease [Chryseobacterium sp.]|nr:CPBP family intramembrane metalloprotease [Chryseobacterium sp.]